MGMGIKQVDGKNLPILPAIIGVLLTPCALAYWIASDGYYNNAQKGSLTISTDSYTAEEVDQLRSILLDQYGINSTRVLNGMAKVHFGIRFGCLEGIFLR
jgi:hypothetical protein